MWSYVQYLHAAIVAICVFSPCKINYVVYLLSSFLKARLGETSTSTSSNLVRHILSSLFTMYCIHLNEACLTNSLTMLVCKEVLIYKVELKDIRILVIADAILNRFLFWKKDLESSSNLNFCPHSPGFQKKLKLWLIVKILHQVWHSKYDNKRTDLRMKYFF